MKAALPLLALSLTLAACVPASRAPAPGPASMPPPPPVARHAPAPATPPPVVQAIPSDKWMDAPATPGDWRYGAQSGGGMAVFSAPGGAPLFMLECDRETGPGIMLFRTSDGNGERVAVVRTETATRAVPISPTGNGHAAWLAPRDPLLDAMALSKGRFAVEVDGQPPLYLPSWAEVTRVIEDCR